VGRDGKMTEWQVNNKKGDDDLSWKGDESVQGAKGVGQ